MKLQLACIALFRRSTAVQFRSGSLLHSQIRTEMESDELTEEKLQRRFRRGYYGRRSRGLTCAIHWKSCLVDRPSYSLDDLLPDRWLAESPKSRWSNASLCQ